MPHPRQPRHLDARVPHPQQQPRPPCVLEPSPTITHSSREGNRSLTLGHKPASPSTDYPPPVGDTTDSRFSHQDLSQVHLTSTASLQTAQWRPRTPTPAGVTGQLRVSPTPGLGPAACARVCTHVDTYISVHTRVPCTHTCTHMHTHTHACTRCTQACACTYVHVHGESGPSLLRGRSSSPGP